MTSVASVRPTVTAHARGSSMPVAVLGLREAKRILKSPVYAGVSLLLFGTMGLSVIYDFPPDVPEASAVYDFIFFVTALYAGLLTYGAAHLVSSSSRRTHADRQLAASPMVSRARWGGLCLGVLLGPGGVALILMAVLAWLGTFVTLADGNHPVSVAELAQILLTVVGAGLFGVLTSTWLRFPGSLPVGMVVLVFGTLFVGDSDRGNTLPWFAPYISSPDWLDTPWTLSGSQMWHAFYLAGLCAMAVCGVMLRERDNRSRWIVASSVTVAATALVGWAQL